MNARASSSVGHENFQDRLARIEVNQSRRSAGGRASFRMERAARASRPLPNRNMNIVSKSGLKIEDVRLTWVERLKFWSIGCLIGSGVTLGKTAIMDPDSPFGASDYYRETAMNALLGCYGFLFLVALIGFTGYKQRPGFAQFSIALAIVLVMGIPG